MIDRADDDDDDDDFLDAAPLLKLPANYPNISDNSAVNIDSIPLPDPTPLLIRCKDKGGFARRADMKPPTTATKPAERGHKSISKDLPTINAITFDSDSDSTNGLSKFLVIISDGQNY